MQTQDKKDLFIVILRAQAGNVSAACEGLGISRATFYNWMGDKKFSTEVNILQEDLLDFAESKLLENIALNSTKDIHYYLDAKGKNRGYGKSASLEINMPGGPTTANPSYPPEPASLEEWEQSVRNLRTKHRQNRHSPASARVSIPAKAGPDGHPDNPTGGNSTGGGR